MFQILEQPDQPVTPQGRAALVSVMVGQEYLATWSRVAKPGVLAYAQRHDLDVIVITCPLDTTPQAQARSPAWQKCLILDQPWSHQYDRLVWMDADIMINPQSPNILEGVPEEKVGCVLVTDQFSLAETHILYERILKRPILPRELNDVVNQVQSHVYRGNKVATTCTAMVSTGVLVLSPAHHQELLRTCYAMEQCSSAYEQPALSHLIQSGGYFHPISSRFNWLISPVIRIHHHTVMSHRDGQTHYDVAMLQHVVRNEMANAYFLHFAEMFQLMKIIV